MKTARQNLADQPCLMFEFMFQTTRGIEVAAYELRVDEADHLSGLFNQIDALDPKRTFIEFASVRGRLIQLNLNFLIGISRLDFIARPGGNLGEPIYRREGGRGIHDWRSFSDSSESPSACFLISGFKTPLICRELAREDIALAAALLQEEPARALIRLRQEDDLHTLFIPARNVIIMDSIVYHEDDLAVEALESV